MTRNLNQILQAFEANIQNYIQVAIAGLRQELEQAEHLSRAGAPAHGPVTAPCVVCGKDASTYRWGQSISRWDSMSNIRGTFTTIRWQEFDPNFEVGWFPVCTFHAMTLDNGRTLTRRSEGYHCG